LKIIPASSGEIFDAFSNTSIALSYCFAILYAIPRLLYDEARLLKILMSFGAIFDAFSYISIALSY